MQHIVDALHSAFRYREIGEVAFDKVDAGQVCEIVPMAGNQAVSDSYLFTTPQELFCKVGSDEAGAPCHQV
jgi:hypothetical protein